MRLLEIANHFKAGTAVDVEQTVHDDQCIRAFIEQFSGIDFLMRRIHNRVEVLIDELRKRVVIRPAIADLENSLRYRRNQFTFRPW